MQKEFKSNPSTITNSLNLSALSCFKTMELLHDEHGEEFIDWLISYHILASTTLELFGKLKIAKRHFKNDGSITELLEKFTNFSHELHKLYSTNGLGTDFMKAVGIQEVKLINKKREAYRYEFILQFEKKPIIVYNPESLKYWTMSTKRQNFSVATYQTTHLLNLCKKVQEASYNDDI
jgi:hypothetical protein